MDVLTDVLQCFRLKSQVYGRLELTAPWGLRLDVGLNPHPVLFVVTRGTCWLDLDEMNNSVPLAGGDFVLLPRGTPCVLRDHPQSPVEPMETVFARAGMACDDTAAASIPRYGGGGSPVSLISGCLQFEEGGATVLVGALPPMIHVRGDQREPVQWLASTLQFLACESASASPGSEAIRSRLAEILFVQAIRVHIADLGGHPAGWLRALKDRQIGKALQLIHATPADPWTVETLAGRVAMSRSSFSDRFTAFVGEPPLRYLTRWRMIRACQMLRKADSTLAVVARAVGYEGEASFAKAFKREIGTTPGEYRLSGLGPSRPAPSA